MEVDRYIILCRDDSGMHRLLTRRTFNTIDEAKDRIVGIPQSRDPMVAACDRNTVILRREEL